VGYTNQLKVPSGPDQSDGTQGRTSDQATTSRQVDGSAAKGRKMVADFSRLMLRAYNSEADNLSRGTKPYNLATAIDRLHKVSFTIERLGETMAIRVSADHQEVLARGEGTGASRASCARWRHPPSAESSVQEPLPVRASK
jgi:hypothetical protein